MQRVKRALVAALVVGLFVPEIESEEAATEVPIAEPVPAAEPVANDGSIPAPKPGPAMKSVPTAEPIPTEPVSDTEDESSAASVPAAEMIVAPAAAPTAAPVPVAEPVLDDGNLPAVEPSTVAEAVSVGDLEPGVDMTPGGSLDSILATDLDTDAETSPYTEELLALGPPWVAPSENTMTLREMFLRSHREQLEIYDLDHDDVISEEEWKAANEDDLARGEKFFVVDKNEDGEIDENEAVGFLMERVSLSSTYIDATSEDGADITRGDIKEHAPSELRVTLFSIPLGD